MPSVAPFSPGTTVSLSCTTSSARAAINLPAGQNLAITNIGPDLVYVALGDVTVAALVATGFPILPGTQITITLPAPSSALYLAGICPTSTATLKLSSGDGIVSGVGGGTAGAAGENVTIVGPLGQALMAASIPVVVASNQSAIPTSVADGSNVVEGAVADAAATAGGTGTVSAKLRRISTQLPAAVGQAAMAASLPVVIASDQMTTGAPTTGGSALPTKAIIYDSAAAAVTYLSSINGGTPVTQTGMSFLNIAAGQATTTVKSGAGVLVAIIFNGPATATSTMIMYDNTAGSGTVIGRPLATAIVSPTSVGYGLAFGTGLTIVTAAANGADMTVVYR